jgi:[ribosomal protein S5]-alanine N-acetyltransferase
MAASTMSVYLRTPTAQDLKQFISAARASRSLHAPWTKAPATPKQFRDYLKKMSLPANRPFLICHRKSHELVGVVNITNIVMGAFRSGYLGYYVFSGFERRGLMRQGLRLVIRNAFSALKLHRLEANIQPSNKASIALVKSCGFKLEGYSPRYLKINNRWQDHERWAILAS